VNKCSVYSFGRAARCWCWCSQRCTQLLSQGFHTPRLPWMSQALGLWKVLLSMPSVAFSTSEETLVVYLEMLVMSFDYMSTFSHGDGTYALYLGTMCTSNSACRFLRITKRWLYRSQSSCTMTAYCLCVHDLHSEIDAALWSHRSATGT
jgi:hypothetical protein